MCQCLQVWNMSRCVQIRHVARSSSVTSGHPPLATSFFFDERPKPYMVYLVGYGDCKGQICVARLFENHHVRENGNWESCTRCYRLEVGDALLISFFFDYPTALTPFIPSTIKKRFSKIGTRSWEPLRINQILELKQ